MARIVVGSSNLTQPLLLYPGLGPAMLEQHSQSFQEAWCDIFYLFIQFCALKECNSSMSFVMETIYSDIH
jgi:hypothetical protein